MKGTVAFCLLLEPLPWKKADGRYCVFRRSLMHVHTQAALWEGTHKRRTETFCQQPARNDALLPTQVNDPFWKQIFLAESNLQMTVALDDNLQLTSAFDTKSLIYLSAYQIPDPQHL